MSIQEQAAAELQRSNFSPEEQVTMRLILRMFFTQWDSGGAVAAMSPVLTRLIAGQPLSPLTGEDDEWSDPTGDGCMLQNKRCSTVFKVWRMPDGSLSEKAGEGALLIYDLNAGGPDSPRGVISFPYDPVTRHTDWPMVEF